MTDLARQLGAEVKGIRQQLGPARHRHRARQRIERGIALHRTKHLSVLLQTLVGIGIAAVQSTPPRQLGPERAA